MAELLPYIFNAIVIAGLMYMAWRDGFEQGQSTANRKHTKWWSDLRGRCIRIAEQVHGLDNRIDGIEARLAKLEHPDATVVYANNEPYAVIPDTKPEDWDCDTCVNDGDMSHLQCRYCNEGSCYIKKEEPLKFDHEPSGEVVGRVTETEDTGCGMRFKISPYDEYTASNDDQATVLDNAVKPSEEIIVKEDTDANTDSN